MFIVLEGVEGAGKSTQARLLSPWIEGFGFAVVMTREPGGTPVGEAIRRIVLDRGDLTMPAETELFLILGARAAFTKEVVRPALHEGKVVLADRFDLSTFAYQGFGRGLDLAKVREANAIATGGLKPDLSLILDLPVEEGLARKGGGQDGDRIEKEGAAFLSRVLDGYRVLAKEDETIRLIPAQGTPEEVQNLLRRALAEAFPETFSFDEV